MNKQHASIFGTLRIKLFVPHRKEHGIQQGRLVTLATIHCERSVASERYEEWLSLNPTIAKQVEATFYYSESVYPREYPYTE